MEVTENMGSYEDDRTYKARELYILSDKIEELHRIKEQLKQAKDEAMQSWLDSRPLIDELEKLQAELANAKLQSENTIITKLESELMGINISIRVKKEEDLKARTEINEMTRVSESLREEMERNKLEITEGKRARSKIKMEIKMRRQTLRTLKLTLRAVRLETEAYRASAEAALEQITRSQASNHGSTVELTQEDYFALMRRAKEEESLADWRVVVATEQRLAAEESRDLALKRLSESTVNDGLMKNKNEEEMLEKEVASSMTPFPKARAKLMAHGGSTREMDRRQTVSKKKRSIFVKVKSFFARKMKYLFG
ncbi:putative WEB family protein [Helianthus annuus]|uniref:Putative WEB family n=1 Tax=Helianthus annuus TaxID=4232 RepID=A0A251T4W8_HELAN|nr:putative WEB family protein [Helianthus annuus]KAJ0490631.1 putative WEB family protein [Helianthus annuus]KAJ0494908.1 putative WEB family protein [Helianthus annuus]KAJ0506549.1 putative WEB family protein [Helianthus annuus]KAJ0676225.1 putative WEB family protein [Helianthus annuus]